MFENFSWLNASYVPVLKQLQDSDTKNYYFSGSSDGGRTPIKFCNPKYLSMLNHLRFYIPEVFPALKKVSRPFRVSLLIVGHDEDGPSLFFLGSNKVMQVLGLGFIKSPRFLLRGNLRLFFTNLPKEEVVRFFEEFEVHDFAKTGSTITEKCLSTA
ncbi:hypothetical protein IFM89_036429 [Coptis chinensis]|uniref:Hexosyltransferase n=1 Tax=Coptis chinensis TaxID=261450 RepID=A0A835M2Q1_9MAGN|nr:hypothetical protein IFM89_036429 [Coptis chinensis]